MDLRRIYQSALKLLVPLSTEETYSTVLDQVINLVGAKHGSIFLAEDGKLKRVYASCPNLYRIKTRKDGNTYRVFLTQKPYILPAKDVEAIHPQLKNLDIGSDMCVPLAYGKITRGVLSILSPAGRIFSQTDLRIIEFFAPFAALSIRNAQLYNQTQQALEQRDLFISMTTHELKNPLSAVMLYTQMIAKKINEKQLPDPKYLINLQNSLNRLINLINDLSQANQIKMGDFQLELDHCSIYDTIRQTVIESRHNLSNHPIHFRNYLNTKQTIICDQNRITQAIVNVLNNAAKFSQPGDPIKVELKKQQDFISICVTDKGKGISRKDLNQIYDRFYKSNPNTPGMGLGLYIAKGIIDKHQGQIIIKSKPRQGTSFTILLPTSLDAQQSS